MPSPAKAPTDTPMETCADAPIDVDADALVDVPVEASLDDAVLQILGEDPTTTVEYGKEIHKELASRFEHVATTGLTKELRKELCEKYLVPSNCTRIGAPQLNAEIKAALNEALVKRDKAIEARQKQIAAAISCVMQIAADQLSSKDTDHDTLKKAMDAGRLLSDIQYAESTTRRNFATFSLKKEMKDHLFNTKIDKYLFGESLPEALKTAKAVTKTSSDLKVEAKKKQRPTGGATSKPAANNLNWKSQANGTCTPALPWWAASCQGGNDAQEHTAVGY
ncbi:hypothetical protein NE865_13452 [Phthorimaea operculella]|nr:hypothetical protein NE865_13452 [Phthorimaea operculella]